MPCLAPLSRRGGQLTSVPTSRVRSGRRHRLHERFVSSRRVALDEVLPIAEASRTLSRALERIGHRQADHLVIARRSRPAAVLISVDRYEEFLRAASAATP